MSQCLPILGGVVCYPDEVGVRVKGKSGRTYTFDFDRYGGPLFTKANGDPLQRQPAEHHEAWDAFGAWFRRNHPPAPRDPEAK